MSALPFIEAVLVFHDLPFEKLHALLEQGVTNGFVLIGPLRADVGGAGAADLMGAGLEEGKVAQVGLGSVHTVD